MARLKCVVEGRLIARRSVLQVRVRAPKRFCLSLGLLHHLIYKAAHDVERAVVLYAEVATGLAVRVLSIWKTRFAVCMQLLFQLFMQQLLSLKWRLPLPVLQIEG